MDELPGVEDYLTLLDKACEVPWRHGELFKEPREEGKPAPLVDEGDQAEDV